MSRYYDIQAGDYHWTSHPSGPSGPRDPGALAVDLDITATPGDVTHGTGLVRIWGPGLDVIKAANKLANQSVTVKAGMGAGISDPSHAGQIAGGTINKTYGTWEGLSQALELQITLGGSGQVTTPTPGPNPKVPPLNLVLNWKKGKPIGPAIQQAIEQGMQGFSVDLRVSDQIVAPQNVLHAANNLYELSTFVRDISRQILGDDKMGISMSPNGSKVVVDDGSQPKQSGKLSVAELIGMPTWIDINTIQVKAVMRADINPLETITLPQDAFPTGQYSLGTQTNQNSYSGSFYVNTVRYVGSFRAPDASAWVTVVEASAQTGAS